MAWRAAWAVGGAFSLAACAGGGDRGLAPPAGTVALDCAPFARALSGVALSGDADAWWMEASGRYARVVVPEVGGVLVFARSDRLPHGHVGVVSRVVSAREVELTQANWVHRRITVDQAAIDVSPRNDWTLVRVFWPPSGSMGSTIYRTYGFILADRPATHEQIARNVARAAEIAVNP
jgi:hypothetical protein